MQYTIFKNTPDEFISEITAKSFRTRIVFDFEPYDGFKGFAVGCNYSYKGNPLGFLKDNGKNLTQTIGKRKTSVFEIDDTVIQAGPTLVDCQEKLIEWKKENFYSNEIIKGFHVHIGIKKNGNILMGFSENRTLGKIANLYLEHHALSAIKLPGLKVGSFCFKSMSQEIKKGLFPIPVALIIEPKLECSSTLNEFSDLIC
jgi:hypothetical protein